MDLKIPPKIVEQLEALIEQQKRQGAPIRMHTPIKLAHYILSSVANGIQHPNSRDRILLEILRLVPNVPPETTNTIEYDNPAKVQLCNEFWRVFRELKVFVPINWSPDPDYIMVNLNFFKEQCKTHNMKSFDLTGLRRALRCSKNPLFIAPNRSVRRKTDGKIVKCWVFKEMEL